MVGGGLMCLVAYGLYDMYDFELKSNGRFHKGYSTVICKGKYKKFTGKENFYKHIKKSDNKITKKSVRNDIRERGPIIDEYSGEDSHSRYIINKPCESTIPEHKKLFRSNEVYIIKGIYVNNNRKYRNFELLCKYSKSDYYQYITNTLHP